MGFSSSFREKAKLIANYHPEQIMGYSAFTYTFHV